MCEKPADAPEYAVGINYTSELVVDQPHIFSILRKSDKAMTVSFKVLDAKDTVVVDETTVTLGTLSADVDSKCLCQRPAADAHEALHDVYGQNYGLTCGAWDQDKCDQWWGKDAVGGWCCSNWCYASKDCPDAFQSSVLDGVFYSYKACPAPPASTCKWTAQAEANDPCACKNKVSIFSDAMKAKNFDILNYGSTCLAWDNSLSTCENFYRPDQVDVWCCKAWCYVEESCPSAIPSVNDGMEGKLWWSDNVCVDDAKLVTQCKYKPEPNLTVDNKEACKCNGEKMPAEIRQTLNLPAALSDDYGSACFPHDAELCDKIYPGSQTDMWCCMSWCWVDETCPGRLESTIWPGHYRSETGCDMNPDAITGCPFSDACECQNPPNASILASAGKPVAFQAGYGATCGAWDSVQCATQWAPATPGDWCCDSWCYVTDKCPVAKISWMDSLPGFEGKFFFSYETCDDGPEVYINDSDTCAAPPAPPASRRLRADENGEVTPRRLSARRRGKGWSSSSFSSPRRRSPSASSAWSRRRSTSAPSAPPPARRRAPPPPVARRRAPPPPVEAQHRRRSTGMDGNAYSAARRRGVDGSTSSYDGNYGYNNRPQMMNNYGNQMPYQTPYGYSGYNAYPAQSNHNMLMYAGGGLAVGYLAGSYFSSSDGYHRYYRRRFTPFGRDRYCFIPRGFPEYSWWDSPGDMLECSTCFARYDYCLYADECQSARGCGYQTQNKFNRDDLAATGFIPKDYTPPLRVIFTKIESADLNPDPMSGSICPPRTDEQKKYWEDQNLTQTIKMDLFVVLTRQEKLDGPTDANKASLASLALPLLTLLASWQ
eukprot:TRINITY_DN29885_c0_g1_i1.p1 TRINITY_DN29885_c0_g1~~TRINITY_DN29885_c0_g1_i1.p1  ORF type:complete len:888 (-),score=122.93 TRINITY_DN29885_c0_g1_i1:208-2685(-)